MRQLLDEILHASTTHTEPGTERPGESSQWILGFIWKGECGTFEDVTIFRHEQGFIRELRDDETGAPLYDWIGISR